ELQRWLQALDMREKQRATHALHYENSGSWFLEGTEFARWKEQPGCLWLRGNCEPLCFWPIDKCLTSSSCPADAPKFAIAYFYFDFRDEKKQLLETMLRSIIMQLSEQSPIPYSVLDLHFQSCQGGKFPTHDDLLVMLDTILSQFSGTYFILDALDECSEHDELVEFISTLRGWTNPVHLLVASQPRTIFLESLAFKEALVVVLEPDTTHADILQFVNSELELNSKLKHIKKAKDVAPKIVDKSNGMFRMAACLLQELTRKRVDTNIDKILAKLLNDLFGIYARFLQPIDEADFVYVAALLRWIAFSARPVTLLELDEALAINFSEPDRWVFEPENRERVKAVCGLLEGLVAVGPVSESDSDSASEASEDQELLVTLAHSSVADYIVSEKFLEQYKEDLKEPPSHTFLAQSCVTYLLHFENNPLNAHTLPQYPLARYAATFWSHHLLRCNDRGVLQHSTMHLLEQGSKQFTALNCVCDIDNSWRDPDWLRHALSPLYLCSAMAYIEGVRLLLEHGADMNTVGGRFGSALQGAASKGHVDIVRILLEKGADVNTVGGEYGSALQGAAANGDVDIAHILLEKGADVNAAGGKYGSALLCAAREGHADIARVLLEKGANMNAVDREGDSALQVAASRGHLDIVRVLVENSTDINAVGRILGSALQAAAPYGRVDIVRLLLEHGTDVNAAGGAYGSALQAASAEGRMDIVPILLEHGADVNKVGGAYGSALQAASAEGRMDIIRILLEHGADVNAAEGGYRGSALQGAAHEGHVEIVRLLLDHGANVHAVGRTLGSALQGAAWRGHVDIVRLLLEKGADANAAGGSVLQAAAARGHMVIISLLLELGADVNAAGGRYGSALQCAARNGYLDVVHILLEKGADVNAAGGEYGSALGAASAKGHEEIAKLLREHGALDAEPGDNSK
ncbi:ankyrin repeat-containing domain protein, partial [Mycena polygramma]